MKWKIFDETLEDGSDTFRVNTANTTTLNVYTTTESQLWAIAFPKLKQLE